MKERFNEIDVIRCVVTIMLVLYHSFAPFLVKAWDIYGVETNNIIYSWLAKCFYSGFLEAFVCISGFLFAKVKITTDSDFFKIFIKKFIKLYVPCVVWGIVWMLIASNKISILRILNGCGHLWFIPMLLCCFLLEYILVYKLKIEKYSLLIYLIIAIFPYFAMPFHLNNSFYYLFFFHIGNLLYKYKEMIYEKISRINIWALLLCYVVCFVGIRFFLNSVLIDPIDASNQFEKRIIIMLHHCGRLLYSFLMVLIYLFVGIKFKNYSSKTIHKVAVNSFGIYLFQEIVLRILYYKTSFCFTLGSILFPWIATIVCFILSYCLTNLFRKNKVTKLFIGE